MTLSNAASSLAQFVEALEPEDRFTLVRVSDRVHRAKRPRPGEGDEVRTIVGKMEGVNALEPKRFVRAYRRARMSRWHELEEHVLVLSRSPDAVLDQLEPVVEGTLAGEVSLRRRSPAASFLRTVAASTEVRVRSTSDPSIVGRPQARHRGSEDAAVGDVLAGASETLMFELDAPPDPTAAGSWEIEVRAEASGGQPIALAIPVSGRPKPIEDATPAFIVAATAAWAARGLRDDDVDDDDARRRAEAFLQHARRAWSCSHESSGACSAGRLRCRATKRSARCAEPTRPPTRRGYAGMQPSVS